MGLIDWGQVVGLTIAVTAIVGTIMSILVLFTLRDRNRSRYDDLRNRAVLSEMRASYEAQLALISRQLVATEERWRDANHLILASQEHQSEVVPSTSSLIAGDLFVKSLGINLNSLKMDPKLVFVLTPFSREEQKVFEVIQEVCQRNGLRCVRGDEEHVSGDILTHIVAMILRSRVVVANVSSRNPNVFYELGIAHALGKQSVLISETIEKVPFDIRSRRVITFSSHDELAQRWADALLRSFSEAAPSQS